jgi:hypothetical protein
MKHFDEELSLEFRGNEVQLSRVIVEVDGEIFDDTYYNQQHLALDAEGSSVSYDRQGEARTSGNFAFHAKTVDGLEALDPITGAVLYPMSGTIVEGQIIWVPLGKLVIEEGTTQRTRVDGHVQVSVVDLSERVRERKWKAPFQTGGGTYRAAIEAILADRVTGLADFNVFTYLYTTENAPDVTYTEDDDPWSMAFNLSISSRSELYFEKNGYLALDEVPDPANLRPVYHLGGGQISTEIGRREIAVSRRDVYNGVIVKGEAPWLLFPISGEYWDDNPGSDTYRGRFGEKPYKMGSPTASTDAQCDEIAETEYHRRAGVTEEVTFRMLKDPILEVGRLLAVVDTEDQDLFYLLDRLEYPMGAQPMSGTIRRKRLG